MLVSGTVLAVVGHIQRSSYLEKVAGPWAYNLISSGFCSRVVADIINILRHPNSM